MLQLKMTTLKRSIRGCRFVPYTVSETKPQMVPGILYKDPVMNQSGFHGMSCQGFVAVAPFTSRRLCCLLAPRSLLIISMPTWYLLRVTCFSWGIGRCCLELLQKEMVGTCLEQFGYQGFRCLQKTWCKVEATPIDVRNIVFFIDLPLIFINSQVFSLGIS